MLHGESKLNNDENLKAENEFLKMKIMLEHGGIMQTPEKKRDEEFTPELENNFLNNIIEFEKQFEQHKMIKVFDRLGRPAQFKAVKDIPDDAFEDEWRQLSDYMQQFGVELGACSPNVSAKELYRFAVEELFEKEMEDIDLPGMTTHFIYDEFYPDHTYDNTNAAVDCLKLILSNRAVEFIPWLAAGNLTLNAHRKLTANNFKKIINEFKGAFEDIELTGSDAVQCEFTEGCCTVTGSYEVRLTSNDITVKVSGSWLVQFAFQNDDWLINDVQLKNLEL